MVQDARIQRVLEFLKEPSQLNDKDLAAKVCLCAFPMPPSNCQGAVSCVVMLAMCKHTVQMLGSFAARKADVYPFLPF